jgi:thiamine kinase-like enzyme
MGSDIQKAADRENFARATCEGVLGEEIEAFENPLTVLASPAWRGVEADVWRATRADNSVIAKHYHGDTKSYVDFSAAIEAATVAGHTGAGPKVLLGNAESGIVVLEDLAENWVAGGLHHARDPVIRANVIAAKKLFQDGPTLPRTANIFDEIETMYDLANRTGIRTHTDVAVFKSFLDDARARIASLGRDSRPCHRDGNTANLMVHVDKRVKLIDFDLAANCDPFEDVGCYLVEFFENDADARPGFEEWLGYFDEGQFQRAMLYGLADDMRWGLIGSIMAATSPRSHLEFGKYASWRFLRLEMHAKRSDANDRIRTAR